MSQITVDQLYERLPAAMRTADLAAGGALRAALEIIAAEADQVARQADELFETPFIETCPEWAVPYIAELLDVALINDVAVDAGTSVLSQRARVANTVRYRRRKGTASVLESLAFDVAGWRTVAVEQFERLATTQSMLHPRVELPSTVDLRDGSNLEATPGPFGVHARTIDVRNVRLDDPVVRERPNVATVILHSHLLDALSVPAATAQPGLAPDQYLIDLLGRDHPLFNPPEADRGIDVRTSEDEVPARLRRRRLREQLDARRTAALGGTNDPAPRWDRRAPFEVFVVPDPGDSPIEVDPLQIEVCHLDPWKPPSPLGRVRLDPVLGRLVFPDPQPHRVLVSGAIGMTPGVGATPGRRPEVETSIAAAAVDWQRGVSRDADPIAGELVTTLADAIDEWNATPPGTTGVICVLDNHRHDAGFTGGDRIRIPEGSSLTIVAAGWPELPVTGGAPDEVGRRLGVVTADGLRPAISGDIEVRGLSASDGLIPGSFTLDGFLYDGTLTVSGGVERQLGRLVMRNITQAAGEVRATGPRRLLAIEIAGSQLGPLLCSRQVSDMSIGTSVIDGAGAATIIAVGAALHLEQVTVIGSVDVRTLDASNSLFVEPVTARLRQEGCVRYSYLPPGSVTARQYACLSSPPPVFVSNDRGTPAYALLAVGPAEPLWTASEFGDQIGAFGGLRLRHRFENLVIALSEYLRIGTDAGILRTFSDY